MKVWQDSRKEPLRTCTMMTVHANTDIREFDTRMPAILEADHIDSWLDPSVQNIDELLPLLRTYEQGDMSIYPVTPLVANDEHDNRECIQEMDLQWSWIKP